MTVIGINKIFKWDIGDLVMLTGAGFTKNMGGLVSADMFSQISNHKNVRSKPALRSLLLSSLIGGRDYEEAYSKVLSEDHFSPEEKENMREAILDAYRHLHQKISMFNQQHPDYFDFRNFTQLLTIFNPPGPKRCPIFTLNQDLFFEYTKQWHAPASPIFRRDQLHIGGGIVNPPFQQIAPVTWDDVCEGIEMHNGPFYIKLHGSYGWLSSSGNHTLVMGRDKQEQIKSEPLLKNYFQIFELALLKSGKKKIVVIGYGFRDPHINEVLLNAVTMNGSKLFIISPSDQRLFYQRLGEEKLDDLVPGIECYYQYTLKQIFFTQKSPEWEQIKTALLAPI